MYIQVQQIRGAGSIGTENPAAIRAARPVSRPRVAGLGGDQSIIGAMIRAKAFRARLSRLFTVPRLQPVISAISS